MALAIWSVILQLTICEAVVLHMSRLRPYCIPVFANGRGGQQKYNGSAAVPNKEVSMEEANLTCSDISIYGAYVPKLPQSVVTKVEAIKKQLAGSRIYNYVFQGACEQFSEDRLNPRRHWMINFAKERFAANDLLVCTDAPASYIPMGEYDRTLEIQGYLPHDYDVKTFQFDPQYFLHMAQSIFTLCPGGDRPWSQRFYEAIAAGSIPVIQSVKSDYNSNASSFWFNQLGYTYFTTDEVAKLKGPRLEQSKAKLKRIADENYELFVKYQTWIIGDMVPPAYSEEFSDRCLSSPGCSSDCAW